MGRHVIVNRLEIPHLTRDAYNSTLRCQASNTKLAPPVERIVRLDMLCKYLCVCLSTPFPYVIGKKLLTYNENVEIPFDNDAMPTTEQTSEPASNLSKQ